MNLEMFSYNTSMHEGMKFITHELMFGKFAFALSVDTSFGERQKGRMPIIIVICSSK